MKIAPLPPKKELRFRSLAGIDPGDITFSVCSYNVLIQDFISPERYPTVQNTSLVFDKDRRRKMLVQDVQLLQEHVDIFCFEEMCPETFHDFQAALGDEFAGDLVKRQVDSPLHNAMFYNKSKFLLEQYYDLTIHKNLANSKELPTDLAAKFKNLEFHTICNHFSFQHQGKKKHLLVAMTHFHHDPADDVIKYAEMSGLLDELSHIYNQIHQDVPGDDIYVVLAGDFNAQPSNQVCRLLAGEKPSTESLEQETMVLPEWLEQRRKWLPLYLELFEKTDTTTVARRLRSVYSLYGDEKGENGHPSYTNHTDSFSNTIDYIFYDVTRLIPTKLLELDTETYEKEGFLPSSLHASDHVILLAEFKCLL